MDTMRRGVLLAAIAGALVVGGIVGATSFGAGASSAQSSSTTSTSSSKAAPSGTFHPNENAQHEAGESARREAQEDAGQFPTVP